MAESTQILYDIQKTTGEEIERAAINHRRLPLARRTHEAANKQHKYLTTLWEDFHKTHGILDASVNNKITEYWKSGYYNFIKNKYEEGIIFLKTFDGSDKNASSIDLDQVNEPIKQNEKQNISVHDIDEKTQKDELVISDNVSESENEANTNLLCHHYSIYTNHV